MKPQVMFSLMAIVGENDLEMERGGRAVYKVDLGGGNTCELVFPTLKDFNAFQKMAFTPQPPPQGQPEMEVTETKQVPMEFEVPPEFKKDDSEKY